MTLRAVLIGCGRMSRKWLESAEQIDGLSVVGLVDLDIEMARVRAEEFVLTDAVIGTDLSEVLSKTRPDVVFDVVVPSARKGVVLNALKHGCHVLSEKPIAENMTDARELVQAANTAGKLHVIVQNRRYIEGVRRLRAFLEKGYVGRITSMHSDFFLAPHFGGFRETMDHVLLLDMAIHTFDAARYIAGSMPQSVYCHEANPVNSWYANGASAYAIFEFADNITYTYRGSWCAEGSPTSWESTWRIIGEHGTVEWDGNGAFHAARTVGRDNFLSKSEPVTVEPLETEDGLGGHLGVMRDFVEAVQGNRVPETASGENINSLAMVMGAIQSAETRQRVVIKPPIP